MIRISLGSCHFYSQGIGKGLADMGEKSMCFVQKDIHEFGVVFMGFFKILCS